MSKITFLDFFGMGRARLARVSEDGKKAYCPFLEISRDGSYGFVGWQEPGQFVLELWVPSKQQFGGGILGMEVLHKDYYTKKNERGNRGDIRRTNGEFHHLERESRLWGREHCWVYQRSFAVMKKYRSDSANDRNIYVVLFGTGGIQTASVSVVDDRIPGKGVYVQIDYNWTGPVGLRNGKFTCPELEQERGGVALFNVVREYYVGKETELAELLQTPGDAAKRAERFNLDKLKGVQGGLGSQEVVVDKTVSGPRWMAFARNHLGGVVYCNCYNLKPSGFPGTTFRKIPVGSILRCDVRPEPHHTHDGRQTTLLRGFDIELLPEEVMKQRWDELTEGVQGGTAWRDWWNDPTPDDRKVVEERLTRQPEKPALVAKPRRMKMYRVLDDEAMKEMSDAFDKGLVEETQPA